MQNMIRTYPVTLFLIAVTTLVFLAMQLLSFGQTTQVLTVLDYGGVYGTWMQVQPWQLWRLLSAIFVHIGWEHFAFNVLTLYFMGQLCESLFGSIRFLVLYLLAGVMGNLAVTLVTPNVVVAGASTSLFGLFAAVVIVGYFGKYPYMKQLGRNYLMLIGLNLVFNLVVPGISIAGHLGGLLGGAILAFALSDREGHYLVRKDERRLAWFVYVIIVMLTLWLIYL